MSFPHYPDGDVLIIISPHLRLNLHSNVLRNNSPILAKLVASDKAVMLSNNALNAGVTTRYRLELRGLSRDGNNIGYLNRVDIDNTARVIGEDSIFRMPSSNDNGKIPNAVHQGYMNVLGAFYNEHVRINDATIGVILNDSLLLVEIAESLGCVGVVSQPIEIALMKQGQTLYRSIASAAHAWADISLRIKSEIVYKESVIHLVGQWYQLHADKKDALSKETRALCERKVNDLHQIKMELETRIMALYPPDTYRLIETGRSGYSNDIMIWIALCFYRHWMGQMIAREAGSRAPDGGYSFYEMISKAGDAYMDRATLNDFQNRFMMTKKGQVVVENHCLELKEMAKNIVLRFEILGNEGQLDTSSHPVKYLLCAKIHKSDYPWISEAPRKRVRGSDVGKSVEYLDHSDESPIKKPAYR